MCESCETLMINGVLCHEIGCPDAWKDYIRECEECGTNFKPKERWQELCSDCREEYENAIEQERRMLEHENMVFQQDFERGIHEQTDKEDSNEPM